MRVIIKGVPLDLPGPEAILLLQRGVAHLPEESVVDPRTQSEHSGIPTPHGQEQAMVSKPSKPRKGSSKTGTKSQSTPSTASKRPRQRGTESKSIREE
jgi:hypothetical protein